MADIGYALVIIWAFIGIAVKQSATSRVAIPTAVLSLALVAALFAGMRRRWSAPAP